MFTEKYILFQPNSKANDLNDFFCFYSRCTLFFFQLPISNTQFIDDFRVVDIITIIIPFAS